MAYRLRNTSDDSVVQEWANLPRKITFPNGDDVHAIANGHEHGGCIFEMFDRPVVKRPANASQVAAERDRRLALGFDHDFEDKRGVHRIGTTEQDKAGWDEVSKYAGALIDSGDMDTTINIVTDTGSCAVTAPEWRAVEIAAAEYRQPIWAASFVLQALDPIPDNYADDKHWP